MPKVTVVIDCDHKIVIWALGNLFALMTGCQVPHGDMIAICFLPCWLPQQANREASREDCELLLPAKKALDFSLSGGWLKRPLPKTKQDFQPQRIFNFRTQRLVSLLRG